MGSATILLMISAAASAQSHLSKAESDVLDLVSNYMMLERSTEIGDTCFRTNHHRIFERNKLRFDSALNHLHKKYSLDLYPMYTELDEIHWSCSKKDTVNARQLKKEAESALVKIEAITESFK